MTVSKYFIESKLSREIEKGNVSSENIMKARDKKFARQQDPLAKKAAEKAGKKPEAPKSAIKSGRKFYGGMEKGSKNIMKKTGFKVSKEPHALIPGPAADPTTKTVHLPKTKESGTRGRHILKRHEADEGRSFEKGKKKHGEYVPKAQMARKGALVGQHAGSDVLTRELKHRRRDKAYGKQGSKELTHLRKATGEHGWAKKMADKKTEKKWSKAQDKTISKIGKHVQTGAVAKAQKVAAKEFPTEVGKLAKGSMATERIGKYAADLTIPKSERDAIDNVNQTKESLPKEKQKKLLKKKFNTGTAKKFLKKVLRK